MQSAKQQTIRLLTIYRSLVRLKRLFLTRTAPDESRLNRDNVSRLPVAAYVIVSWDKMLQNKKFKTCLPHTVEN